MMITEFEELVDKSIRREEYEKIETVYAYHPCISETEGKQQIAMLYKTFGMAVIEDMLPRAEKAKNLEREIQSLREQMNKKTGELNDLKRGGILA